MIGLDTNLLVRVVTGDDPASAGAVRRFLDTNCTAQHPGYISRIVLCELCWVLTRRYDYARAQIAQAIESIVTDPGLRIDGVAAARRALTRYRHGNADFADYLLGELNRAAGCTTTVTLDRRAATEADFSPLSSKR